MLTESAKKKRQERRLKRAFGDARLEPECTVRTRGYSAASRSSGVDPTYGQTGKNGIRDDKGVG
jgi:hypothetical protein